MLQKKKSGGGVKPKRDGDKESYNAKGSKVLKEAHEMKCGGSAGKKRMDKRARGGGVKASGKDMTKSPFSKAHVSTSGDAGK